MYSLVMMTALTTAPSGMEFNGFFRDWIHGRNSSSQSQSSSCNGGIFHGRIITALTFGGGSCSGSCSGSCTGRSNSCNGCTGSVPSYSCNGCSGSVYSCNGSYASAPKYSCNGGFPTEFGSPYATPLPAYYSSPTITSFGNPVTVVPTVPYFAPTIIDQSPRIESFTGQKNMLPNPTITASQRATVVVRLPADARLYVDQQLLELTSGERTFVTPELPLGREYAYNFKIEYDRNGRTLSESQKVNVTAGKSSAVVFEDLTLAAKVKGTETAVTAKPIEPTKPVSAEKPKAAEELANPFRGNNSYVSTPMPARISITIPADATLFIDGKKNEKPGTKREFTTPPLPFGKEFSYSLKLEKKKNGQPEEVLQKVVFQAGETVTVDFTDAGPERRAGK